MILKATAARLEDLERLNAPEVILTSLRGVLESGQVKVNKLDQFEDLEVTKVERKKGRGGKVFFNLTCKTGETILFFPLARYGAFVTLAEEK